MHSAFPWSTDRCSFYVFTCFFMFSWHTLNYLNLTSVSLCTWLHHYTRCLEMYLFTDTKITFVAVLTRWRGKFQCVKLGEVAVVSALIRGSEQCYEALLYTAALNASLSHTVGYLLLHIQSLSNTFFMLDVKLSLCLLMLDVANSRPPLWTSGTFLSRFSCRREKSLDGNLWVLL